MLRHLILAFCLPVVPALAAAAPSKLPVGVSHVVTVEGIEEYRLANGLQVLLVPDESKPTTTVNMTYRVGSHQESYGETGMAHLLEHLLFKGTPKHPNVWAEFTKRGLRANGSTWLDRTNYFASFSSNEENLKWYLGWQADAMVNSNIAKRDLDTEMTVVRNEMEMGENSPSRILFEKGLATMYQWHNYGKSTIGARSDVENVDIARLQNFYRTYYQPDNATLIVAGRFDPPRTLGWIAQSFGKIPAPKRRLPPLYTLDPVQDGERNVTLRRVGGVPMTYAMYHVPPGPHPDFAAINVLDVIMADAPSGRLHKKLVDGQLAAAVFAFSQELSDPGFSVFGAQLAPGQDLGKAQEAMLQTLESVAKEPITEEELKRARLKWIKDWDLAFSDPERVGVALSEAIAAGDWRLFFLTRDRVRKLTVEQVQRAASAYLLPSNRTLASYVPTEQPVRAPTPQRVDVAAMLRGYTGDPAVKQAEAFDATPANIETRTQRFGLKSGLQAAVLPKGTRGGVVSAQLNLRLGSEASLKGQSIVGQVVAAMLDKGTATLSRQQVQDKLDELQSEVAVQGGATGVTVMMRTRREHLPALLTLVGQMLREPSFPADAFEEVRRQALSELESERKDPDTIVNRELDRRFNPYPVEDVRYVPTFDEQRVALEQLQLDALRGFHQRFYGAAQAQFAAVGDLDVAQVRQALEASFGNWFAPEAHKRVPHPLVQVKPERLSFSTPDRQNAYLRVSLALPIAELHADHAALMLANYLLGQGGNSRLWARVREAEGLSYDVRSGVQFNAWEPNSLWNATAIFAPQNLAKVENAVREEIARALKDGFTAAELEQGRQGLLSFRYLSRAQDRNLAATLAENLYLGRNFTVAQQLDDALKRVTLAEVNAALRKYLKPESFVIGVGGDFKP
ncbi:insulinase family protein [Aquabacterium sp. A7-Y]|uniref:M16 family metallopeptidase n=1 Tax=Aquabacterium sp. A7-Y TaxID=1349605 RepID=UPI00223E3475|nr:pitrilysin family protein [Aquabacterium sp. A7-Y]MCW7541502.1 insulinase family protein [Aquabacterium sp. A7-Y]